MAVARLLADPMIFRQFHEPDSGALSYLIADSITRKAAIVDALSGKEDEYAAAIKALGLGLSYLLETHVHEDHASAAAGLKSSTHARLAIHEFANVVCADIRLRGGDVLYLGEEEIEVIHTPGHAPCSVTYCWRDRLFTGHTLLAGRVGHCARRDADPQRLYESVHDTLYAHPGEYLVYPGQELNGQRLSSIEQERRANRDLAANVERKEFLAERDGRRAARRGLDSPFTAINRNCGEAPSDLRGVIHDPSSAGEVYRRTQ